MRLWLLLSQRGCVGQPCELIQAIKEPPKGFILASECGTGTGKSFRQGQGKPVLLDRASCSHHISDQSSYFTGIKKKTESAHNPTAQTVLSDSAPGKQGVRSVVLLQ